MNITCQSCGQPLPKTVLVCPSCGSRQLRDLRGENLAQTNLSQTNQAIQPAHTTQYHVPFQSQLATQTNTSTPAQNVTQPSVSPAISPAVTPNTMQTATQGIPPSYSYPATPSPNYSATLSTQNGFPRNNYPQNSYPQPSHFQTSYPQSIATTPAYLPPVRTAPLRQANTMQYAGFVRRGLAFVFDVALFSLLTGLTWQYITNNKYKIMYVPNSDLPLVLAVAGAVLYLLVTAFLTSRARQGSIGKRMLGLWVFNMQGQRIGFFHAFFREVVKLALLPFAFVMWFTARKQTLHDLLGRTVVLLDR